MNLQEANRITTGAESFNLVAMVTSKWHLVGVLAFMRELESEGGKVKGIVYVAPHRVNGYMIDISSLPELGLTLRYIQGGEKSAGAFKRIASFAKALWRTLTPGEKATLYLLSPSYPRVRLIEYAGRTDKAMRVKYIVIDEGVGSYMPQSFWVRVDISEGAAKTSYKVRNMITFLARIFFDAEYKLLFRVQPDGAVEENHKIASNYRKVVCSRYEIGGKVRSDVQC